MKFAFVIALFVCGFAATAEAGRCERVARRQARRENLKETTVSVVTAPVRALRCNGGHCNLN